MFWLKNVKLDKPGYSSCADALGTAALFEGKFELSLPKILASFLITVLTGGLPSQKIQ